MDLGKPWTYFADEVFYGADENLKLHKKLDENLKLHKKLKLYYSLFFVVDKIKIDKNFDPNL